MNVKGTIKSLSGKVKAGDMVLGQAELSVITRVGEAAGWCKRGPKLYSVYKGRDPVTWEIDCDWITGVCDAD